MSSDRRVALQPAFILHRKPYRDTSLLLEAFTEEFGRVGLVARGARRSRSALQGLLQPFQPLLLSWSGRGELRTLTGAEPGARPRPLFGTALAAGFYVNELLMRLVQRHDPQPELYLRYSGAVGALASGPDMEWTLRLFERDLLQSSGYGLPLTEEAETGEPVQAGLRYCYHLERGPVATADDAAGLVVSGSALLALASGEAPGRDARQETKHLMRAALRLYLGDRPLASRELFRRVGGDNHSKTRGE